MLQGQEPLVSLFSFLVITGESDTNHELLLESQILQIPVQNSSEVVNGVAFGWQIENDMRAADVSAHVDFLLHDRLRPLLDMWVDGVTVDETIVDLANHSVLPPTVLDTSVYKGKR